LLSKRQTGMNAHQENKADKGDKSRNHVGSLVGFDVIKQQKQTNKNT
jgi:hypothetical protein